MLCVYFRYPTTLEQLKASVMASCIKSVCYVFISDIPTTLEQLKALNLLILLLPGEHQETLRVRHFCLTIYLHGEEGRKCFI